MGILTFDLTEAIILGVIRGKNANWRPLLNSNGDFNGL